MPTPQETAFEAAKQAFLVILDSIAAGGPVPADMDAMQAAYWQLFSAVCALPLA